MQRQRPPTRAMRSTRAALSQAARRAEQRVEPLAAGQWPIQLEEMRQVRHLSGRSLPPVLGRSQRRFAMVQAARQEPEAVHSECSMQSARKPEVASASAL